MDTSAVSLEVINGGVVIPIRARPRGRRIAIEGVHDGMVKVSVTAAPEKGKANKAIVALLSDQLDVPKSSLEIVAGATSNQKRILVRSVTAKSIRNAFEQVQL